MDTQTKTEG